VTVPGFQDITLPLLKLLSDGKERRLADCIQQLADHFALSKEDRDELLPSGRQTRFANRVGWAKTYLSKALLVQSTGRATFSITDRGLGVLAQPPRRIDLPFLTQYSEIKEFRARTNHADLGASLVAEASDASPEELIDVNFTQHRAQLTEELLDRVRQLTPVRFERLVLDVLLAMGYGGSRPDAGEHLGASGDGGVDGVINEDVLGLDVVYVQAKRWEANVGRPEVQSFAGSLDGVRAKKGVFITTSGFSREALDYVKIIEKRIVLVDGRRLCDLMATHGVGVSTSATYEIKRVATEYFED
jgi:restriction system protein